MTPLRVLEQRYGQQYGQLRRRRAFDALAERQLVEPELVGCRKLPIVDAIVDFERQLALLNAVAGVLHGVRRQRREVDVRRLAGEVQCKLWRKRVDRSADRNGRRAFDVRHNFDGSRLYLRQRRHGAGDLSQVRGVIGLDEVIGILHFAVG